MVDSAVHAAMEAMVEAAAAIVDVVEVDADVGVVVGMDGLAGQAAQVVLVGALAALVMATLVLVMAMLEELLLVAWPTLSPVLRTSLEASQQSRTMRRGLSSEMTTPTRQKSMRCLRPSVKAMEMAKAKMAV